MSGSGAILGDVQNGGLIAPGQSPGAIIIQGQYTQTVSGTLGMEVGIAAHDILTITNGAVLTGTLQITLLEEYTPALEDRFQVLAYASHTGTFGTLLLATRSARQPGLGSNIRSRRSLCTGGPGGAGRFLLVSANDY